MSNGGKRKAGIRRGYSLLTFALLVCAGIPLWFFFSPSTLDTVYQRGRLADERQGANSLEGNGFWPELSENGTSYLSIPSDTSLDPEPGKTFLVSFLFSPERFSQEERVFKMMGKYEREAPPYSGWAVALRVRDNSVRTEAYWKGASGSGGWFTFDDFHIVSGRGYVVSLFARSNEFISMYVQEILPPSVEASPHSSGLESGNDSFAGQQVVFAGGYPVKEIDLISTKGSLFISSHGKGQGDSVLSVKEVLVAQSTISPSSRSEVAAFLSGGPAAIGERVDEEQISLWIDKSAKDRSRFSRELGSSGDRS